MPITSIAYEHRINNLQTKWIEFILLLLVFALSTARTVDRSVESCSLLCRTHNNKHQTWSQSHIHTPHTPDFMIAIFLFMDEINKLKWIEFLFQLITPSAFTHFSLSLSLSVCLFSRVYLVELSQKMCAFSFVCKCNQFWTEWTNCYQKLMKLHHCCRSC